MATGVPLLTKEQKEQLLKIHTLYSTNDLCEMFNITSKQLNAIKRGLGIGSFAYKKDIPEGHYRCGSCKEVLPLDNFYIRSSGKPYSICKECMRIKRSISSRQSTINKQANKVKDFIKEHKGETLHCRYCNKDYPIEKYKIYLLPKTGRLYKTCPHCNKTTYAKESESRQKEKRGEI